MDNKLITVRNAEGEPNTEAQIIIQNKIKYTPKVSVVVPVYNVEPYLEECLNSIIKQTLKEIEIICVNDGSPDGSGKILDKYAEKDKRIKIINQKNQGLSCSRNNALTVAQGEYVAFLDSDDYWHKDTLKILYKQAHGNDLDMLSFGGVNFIDGSRELQENPYYQFKYLPKDFKTDCFNYKQCTDFITSMAVSACLTCYKLEFLRKKQIIFPPHLFFEDNVFFAHALLTAERCGICKKTLYFRRIHPESVTQNRSKHFSDYLQICEKVIKLTGSLPINDAIKKKYYNLYAGGPQSLYNGFTAADKKRYKNKLREFLDKVALKESTTYKFLNFIPLLLIEEQ